MQGAGRVEGRTGLVNYPKKKAVSGWSVPVSSKKSVDARGFGVKWADGGCLRVGRRQSTQALAFVEVETL